MKRGVLVIVLFLLVVPFVVSQSLTVNDLFDSRGLSYSSDKVVVPAENLFQTEQEVVSLPPSTNSVYYYVGQNLVASASDSGVDYYYLDRIGSDIESKSLPFGEPITVNNMFSFTGKELDQDLYYFGARYYNPNLGRFISVDPIQENHPYTYVKNNPLNFVDPNGKEIVRYTWTAPTTGSAVEHYVMEGRFGGSPWSSVGITSTNEFTFDIPDPLLATGFQLRVAGVDADSRQGLFSEASDVYYGQSLSRVSDDLSQGNPLSAPYPNPASDRSTIRYYVPEGGASEFKLQIYNIRGELVNDIPVDAMNIGYNEFQWDLRDRKGRDVASGVYFIKYTFKFEFTSTQLDMEGEKIVTRYVDRPMYDTKMTVVK